MLVLHLAYVYTYDNAGNILKKEEYEITSAGDTPVILLGTDTYSYNYYDDEWCYFEWGDLLSYYNGHEITYDEIGNPLSYYNGSSYEFSWDGRELYYAEKDGDSYYFTYNDAGIRTSKTKNGVKTTCYVSGSQIVAEKTNENITVYIYDAEGLPLGMRYHGANYAEDVWDVYWFERNIFGDVVAVYDEAGTKLISYEYDAYGNCYESYYNGGYSTSAVNNPFRYRGYFYDTDLELYYLNSRYYDCNTGRFISADSQLNDDILGLNLFAYCGNNPVIRVDRNGRFWSELWGIVETAVIEIGKAIRLASPAYAGCGGMAASDGPLPFGDIVATAGAALVTVGAIGYGIYETVQSISELIHNSKEKSETVVVPKEPDDRVIFPIDPNAFNPVGLVRVPRDGTKNGAFISWMDPFTNTEVFRWDENPNYSNGPHYHIYGAGHYYPGTLVPEPYATKYFPFR